MVGGGCDPQRLGDFDLWSEIVLRREHAERWSEYLMTAIEEKDAKAKYQCLMGFYQHHARLRFLWKEYQRRRGKRYEIVTGREHWHIPDATIRAMRQEWEVKKGKVTFLALSVKYGMSDSYVRNIILRRNRADVA